MRKWNNAALLLLACFIAAACAVLPGLVSAYQDGKTLGHSYFEEIQPVNLEIREEEALPALAGLAMMSRLDGVIEISESMASMTREEVESYALSVLQGYMDTGLAAYFEPEFYDVRCLLVQVTSDPSLNQIIWFLNMVTPKDVPYAMMGLAIADSSAQVLTIDYAGDRTYSAAQRDAMVPVFAEQFFGSLGISNYGDFATNDLKKQMDAEKSAAVRYRFGDLVYGEVNVDLYVYEYGFYTEFPDTGVNGG